MSSTVTTLSLDCVHRSCVDGRSTERQLPGQELRQEVLLAKSSDLVTFDSCDGSAVSINYSPTNESFADDGGLVAKCS